jgi:hypothetical protein
MSRRLSLLISTVFHPVLINLASLLLLFVLFPFMQYGLNTRVKVFYVLFTFILTGLLPVVGVVILKLTGIAHSIMLETREERTTPYIITAMLYLFVYYFMARVGSPAILQAYLLGSASIVVVVLCINLFTKISIHTSSLGALMAVVISATQQAGFDIRILLAGIMIATGLTATARLFAGSHTPAQLYGGFLLGLVIMLFIL